MVVMVVMVVGGGRVLVLMVFSLGRAVASEVALKSASFHTTYMTCMIVMMCH